MRCRRRCSGHQARTAGVVSFPLLRGRALPAGAVIEIFVTKTQLDRPLRALRRRARELQARRPLPAARLAHAAEDVHVSPVRVLGFVVAAVACFAIAYARVARLGRQRRRRGARRRADARARRGGGRARRRTRAARRWHRAPRVRRKAVKPTPRRRAGPEQQRAGAERAGAEGGAGGGGGSGGGGGGGGSGGIIEG